MSSSKLLALTLLSFFAASLWAATAAAQATVPKPQPMPKPAPMPKTPKITKRTWTSADGKGKIPAVIVKIEGETVHLQKDDKSVTMVPLNNLSAADKKYVETVRAQLAGGMGEAAPAGPGGVGPMRPAGASIGPFVERKPSEMPPGELSKIVGVSIRRSEQGEYGVSSVLNGQGIELKGRQTSLHGALAGMTHAWGPIYGGEHLPSGRFDIEIQTTKGGWEGGLRTLAEAIARSFDLKIAVEDREMEVTVVRRGPDWDTKGLPPANGQSISQGGAPPDQPQKAKFAGPMAMLCSVLQSELKQPVVDETKLPGGFAAEWEYRIPTRGADMSKYLTEHGLTLTVEKRKSKGVFVDPPAAKPEGK
jgi:hypothetical protein